MATSPLIEEFHLQHDSLGELIGWARKGDIVQFRGIPYADIPGRFRQSILRKELPAQPFDARHAGPICPQDCTKPPPALFEGPPPDDAPPIRPSVLDELQCLNLNITIPKCAFNGEPSWASYPVLIYIHGGAFISGAASMQVGGRETFDPANLVRRSREMAKPIIVVTINYRLGPFGFMASKEIEAFNRSSGEAYGNYGLHDQRNAIDWVAEFIRGFGGDPNDITLEGGSAGGASAHFQSVFRHRRFRRSICNSGTVLTLAALPTEVHQKTFDRYRAKFCSGEADDAVATLQAVPFEDVVTEYIEVFAGPVIDNDWIKGRFFGSYIANAPDPPEIMLGASAYEQDLTHAALDSVPREDGPLLHLRNAATDGTGLADSAQAIYTPNVLAAYGLPHANQGLGEHLDAWCELVADVLFKAPALFVALHHRNSKLYLYEFQATNPFPGWPLGYGKANHALADLFLFASGEDLVMDQHREEYHPAVRQVQDDWIKFCYGELQWEPFDPKVLGPVYTFENFGKGRRYETYAEAVGPKEADRCLRITQEAHL